MKKQFILLFLFSIQLSAQNKDPNPHFPKLKTSVPCSREFLDAYRGKWLVPGNLFNAAATNNNYSQGAMQRINGIHSLVKQVYPQPMGSDAYWRAAYSRTYFADKIKYVMENDRAQRESVTPTQVEGWGYSMILFDWFCSGNANEMWNGYPDAGGGNSISVEANNLQILGGDFMDEDGWTIDGRPIKRKMPAIGTWKGYELMATNGGVYAQQNDEFFILLSRQGMLPYIPVTRKQYLDRAIAYTTNFYNQLNVIADRLTDQAEKEETRKRNSTAKNNALKKLQDELEKTKKDGLSDAPAVVRPDPLLMNEGPVFLPEPEGGIMLVIENPGYFRRDLPAYVPQFFVLSWSWGTDKWCIDFKRAIEENFPVERLQAMIDK